MMLSALILSEEYTFDSCVSGYRLLDDDLSSRDLVASIQPAYALPPLHAIEWMKM